ncbi:MAG: DNA gyrase subunit A [Patescibacteria group bacterium]
MPEKENQIDLNLGKVDEVNIKSEMQEAYLDYAMSVIISRALPDVRDGLKPVHRRILYATWAMGLKATAKFRKSATIVGEVLGKYHPHGDSAVYDSLARMAQDFSLRYPLINGQGNWGSIDGDAPAAMRYTEAKMSGIAEELLYDIERETIDFIPNYDGSQKEPKVMPAKLPNLLLNGSMGIAVGMATNIPPHNLTEICDATMHLIENPECIVDDLMEFVKGPDFPTGGIIFDKNEIKQAYSTGRGGIVMQAKTEILEEKGKFYILISEIPYQVNKATLIEKIADLVQEKKLEGIRDIRDESSKEGIRIIIELKKDAYPKKVLNRLFVLTPLQDTFHVNMLALVDGLQPKILTLKNFLEEYIKHRMEVVRRRAEYDLARARERAHILEGLKIAILKIDKVIATIKKSADKDVAKINLMKEFKLSEIQSIAILEMRLQQLANLERLRVEQELKEKMELIKELEALLASKKKMLSVVKDEVSDLKEKYGDERRTKVVAHGVKEFKPEDLVPNEPTIVVITQDGYIKRLPPDTFKAQSRGGKGVMGLTTKEEDIVQELFTTMTHNDLFFFTTRGRVFQLKTYDVPAASRTAKGQALQNFLQLSQNEKVSAVLSFDDIGEDKYLVMATKNGLIKKVEKDAFSNVRRSGLIAIGLKDDDCLEWVKSSSGNDDIMIVTAKGQSVRFKEKDVRPMGRGAAGVHAIRLKKNDTVVGMGILDPKMVAKNMLELFIIMENGYGKKTNIKAYKVQRRGGSGIKTASTTSKTGDITCAYTSNLEDDRDMIIISLHGQVIRTSFKNVPSLGRATQGVRLMRFKDEKDKIASVTFI